MSNCDDQWLMTTDTSIARSCHNRIRAKIQSHNETSRKNFREKFIIIPQQQTVPLNFWWVNSASVLPTFISLCIYWTRPVHSHNVNLGHQPKLQPELQPKSWLSWKDFYTSVRRSGRAKYQEQNRKYLFTHNNQVQPKSTGPSLYVKITQNAKFRLQHFCITDKLFASFHNSPVITSG